jgi:hypothetical protein
MFCCLEKAETSKHESVMLAELLELVFMLRYKRERHILTSVNLGLLGKPLTRGQLRTGVKRKGRLKTAKASERFDRN